MNKDCRVLRDLKIDPNDINDFRSIFKDCKDLDREFFRRLNLDMNEDDYKNGKFFRSSKEENDGSY